MTTTPPNTQPSSTNDQSVASSAKRLFKPKGDIGWRWNSVEDLKNKHRVKCDFCGEQSSGGITRAKQHQLGQKGNAKGCLKTPDDVKKQLQEAEAKKKAAKMAVSGDVNENADEIAELQAITRIRSGKRAVEEGVVLPPQKKNTKGPLDILYYQTPEETLEKEGKQTSRNHCDKKARMSCCQYIARFFYRNGIAFNVGTLKKPQNDG
jgi:hypothetical protein